MTVEERISLELKKSGITKAALCRMIGMSPGALYPSMAGQRELRANEFLSICQVLHLDPWVMGWKDCRPGQRNGGEEVRAWQHSERTKEGGERGMDNYSLRIQVKDGEVEAVLAELEKAQTVIRDCYCKLQNLGVLVVEKEEAASGN